MPSSTPSLRASSRSACGAACAATSPPTSCAMPGSTGCCSTPSIRPTRFPTSLAQLQAVTGGTATPIVRPAWNDTVLIKRFLDIGAQTLLVPYVQNAEEAKRAVEAVRYPTAWHARGRGCEPRQPLRPRHRLSQEGRTPRFACWCRWRPQSALAQLEAIASVEGIDGVFIGPSDLSASLGHVGNPAHPEPQKAMQDAVTRLEEDRQAGRYPHRQRRGDPPLHLVGLHLRRGRLRHRPAARRRHPGKEVQELNVSAGTSTTLCGHPVPISGECCGSLPLKGGGLGWGSADARGSCRPRPPLHPPPSRGRVSRAVRSLR